MRECRNSARFFRGTVRFQALRVVWEAAEE